MTKCAWAVRLPTSWRGTMVWLFRGRGWRKTVPTPDGIMSAVKLYLPLSFLEHQLCQHIPDLYLCKAFEGASYDLCILVEGFLTGRWARDKDEERHFSVRRWVISYVAQAGCGPDMEPGMAWAPDLPTFARAGITSMCHQPWFMTWLWLNPGHHAC